MDDSIAAKHLIAVQRFQETFIRDWDEFRTLWTDDPTIQIPFAPPGMPQLYKGRDGFEEFWRPIFAMEGRFDWTTQRVIAGSDADTLVVTAQSDVDVTFSGGNVAYRGNYIQIFDFKDDLIDGFTEYIDSYAMGKIYGLI